MKRTMQRCWCIKHRRLGGYQYPKVVNSGIFLQSRTASSTAGAKLQLDAVVAAGYNLTLFPDTNRWRRSRSTRCWKPVMM